MMPVSVWAIGLGGYVAEPHPLAFAYDPGDQARTRGLDLNVGAIGPADLSSTTEGGDGEDGFYDRFQDQVETILDASKPVDPAVRSFEMDDPPDRLRRTDRGDVGPAPGAQGDAIDLTPA